MLVAVPTTPFASLYVTTTGIVTLPETFAKFGLSVVLVIVTSLIVAGLFKSASVDTNVKGSVGFAGS